MDKEVMREMEILKLEKKKNLKNLNTHKENLISEIMNSEINKINNTIQKKTEYTIWQRIMKTLGIS